MYKIYTRRSTKLHKIVRYIPYIMYTGTACIFMTRNHRHAGTTGAARASASIPLCIHKFLGAVRVQVMGVTAAQANQ